MKQLGGGGGPGRGASGGSGKVGVSEGVSSFLEGASAGLEQAPPPAPRRSPSQLMAEISVERQRSLAQASGRAAGERGERGERGGGAGVSGEIGARVDLNALAMLGTVHSMESLQKPSKTREMEQSR